ncbi:hypothetical protein FF124_18855 [Martelella lutilitoris]|uniref:DUF2282 domain-containing protein n=1 Tax=Martelella lutilitoris TaxID=2583532 RepID=A0A5C4JL32_9HYPH|nr:hypothetical protein [Martelella lutilitoris]TNB46215.1 hypothetical protein FF124_18855 [Martelella lutilitoris]
MRSILAAFLIMVAAVLPGASAAEPMQSAVMSMAAQTILGCASVANADSCWQTGVAAEKKRGDAQALLATYEVSCNAGLRIGGC